MELGTLDLRCTNTVDYAYRTPHLKLNCAFANGKLIFFIYLKHSQLVGRTINKMEGLVAGGVWLDLADNYSYSL